jgi:hypothetical protein
MTTQNKTKGRRDIVGHVEDYAASIARLGKQKAHIIKDFVPKILLDFSRDAAASKNDRLAVLLDLMDALSECINNVMEPELNKAPVLWKDRDRKLDENPFQFIEKVYKNYLRDMTQSDLRRIDFDLYRAFQHWKNKHGQPDTFKLITKKQMNDIRLSSITGYDVNNESLKNIYSKLRPKSKIYEAVRNRLRKNT